MQECKCFSLSLSAGGDFIIDASLCVCEFVRGCVCVYILVHITNAFPQ